MSRQPNRRAALLVAIAAISIVEFVKKILPQSSTRTSGSATAAEN
jgi:hypothetical protein